MNIYLAVDASISMLLQDSKGESAIKTGTTFVTEFIEAVDKREVDITVVSRMRISLSTNDSF